MEDLLYIYIADESYPEAKAREAENSQSVTRNSWFHICFSTITHHKMMKEHDTH